MDENLTKMLIYSSIGFFVGLYLFFRSFVKLKEKRIIEDTPTSKIRSLAMGRAEISGKVIAKENIRAPFSNTKCATCRWVIQKYVRTKNSSYWKTIKEGISGRYFYIEDETGKVLVDTQGAHIPISIDFITTRSNPTINLALKQFNMQPSIFRSLRFMEYYLVEGDTAHINGYAGDNPFVKEGSSSKNETDIMMQKDGFYIISDRPEREILKKYNLIIYSNLIGGGLLSSVCLYGIFTLLKII